MVTGIRLDQNLHIDAQSAKPWLWMDISTSLRARSGQMNGTLRVEQSYAKTLTELMAPQMRFCRYSQLKRCFQPVDRYPDVSNKPILASRERDSDILSSVRLLGRRLERAVRIPVRTAIRPLSTGRRDRNALPLLGSDTSNEVLLLAGENWSQYDFDVISRMRRERGTRVAALCQDFIPVTCPQFFAAGEFVSKFTTYADFLLRYTDLIISNSESTKSDIVNYAKDKGGVRGRIEVVTHGADLLSVKFARKPRLLSDPQARRFVLSVSTIQSRKNFDLLYHLWRRLTEEGVADLPTLVIVGQPGFGSNDLLWQIEHDPLIRQNIVHLRHAHDEELSWLYQNCLWTLFPSFYEGWGLPLSESLALGKYCLASNTSSLPEAGAGFAKHIDPLDFAAWRQAVLELMSSPDALARIEANIRAGYRPVTWAQSAGILAKELLQLSAKNPAAHNA
jgi:glycosyltransferase involved in cell wall biosynthesis